MRIWFISDCQNGNAGKSMSAPLSIGQIFFPVFPIIIAINAFQFFGRLRLSAYPSPAFTRRAAGWHSHIAAMILHPSAMLH